MIFINILGSEVSRPSDTPFRSPDIKEFMKLFCFQVFRLAGRVVGVELQRDKEGKSRGFAVVVYDHPVEAVQAISMLNNQQLFDRFNIKLDLS